MSWLSDRFTPPAAVPMPPLPPFTPPAVSAAVRQATAIQNGVNKIISAPIKSTIAADPLLSWAYTGTWKSYSERTAAGVHELYKEDRLAQALGLSEKGISQTVEVVGVIVGIYFGGWALGLWGSPSAAVGVVANSKIGSAAATGLGKGLLNQMAKPNGAGVAGAAATSSNAIEQSAPISDTNKMLLGAGAVLLTALTTIL